MYAVVTTGGKQYRVEAGSELMIERMSVDAGSSVTFDRVLLVGDGEKVTVGTPTVDGATVSGTVLGEALGPKLVIFKFKQKVKYRRRTGHRQHLTRVRIDEINTPGSKRRAAKDDSASDAEAPVAEETATETRAEAVEKPKRVRRSAAAEAPDTTTEKPKRTRKAAPKKADSEE